MTASVCQMRFDPDFRRLIGRSVTSLIAEGRAIVLTDGLAWGEGPAWIGSFWIFSDIPNNRVYRFDRAAGLSIFREPSNFANGHCALRAGGFASCEHLSRSVTRTDAAGTVTVLCDSFDGARLNSPNDAIEARCGAIWFTDPTYGILTDVEGKRAPSEQPSNRVYRIASDGRVTAEIEGLVMPNGLCFSPDERTLYVADSGAEMGAEIGFDPQGARDVWAFGIRADGRALGERRHVHRVQQGIPDGMICDDQGNIWVATGAGILVLSPRGKPLGMISTPGPASNLSVGGTEGAEMLITTACGAYILTV